MNIRNGKLEKLLIRIIVFLVFVFVLTMAFYQNSFEIASYDQFKNWQNDSEALVLGRLIKSRQSGLTADYGFLQREPEWKDNPNRFVSGEQVDNFSIYQAQVGLQGLIFGVWDRITPQRNSQTLMQMYLINVMLLASLISMLALWSWSEFNLCAGVFIIVGCIVSPWLTFAAKNLYWVVWTMLAPFITMLCLHWSDNYKRKISGWIFFLASFVTILIKSACGFEFISAILISIELPTIYYALKEKWDKKRYALRAILVGSGGICGFFTVFLINFWQRSMYSGSIEKAWADLVYNIDKRTGFFATDLTQTYQNSLEQPILKVINTYLRQGTTLVLDYRMAELILILAIATAALFASSHYCPSIAENRRKMISLSIMSYTALLSPLSWFVLSKGHSFIHTHINYILWYLPCLLLIFSLCGSIITYVINDFWNLHKHIAKRAIAVLCILLVFIWPMCRFYQTWDWQLNNQEVENVKNQGMLIYKETRHRVYLHNKTLYYIVDKNADISTKFFLHLHPKNLDNLPKERIESKFDNYDFTFTGKMIKLPFWEQSYIAKVSLPDYAIDRIITGQFDGSGRLWETTIKTSDHYPVPQSILPADLSDNNWRNGISNSRLIILLPNEPINYDELVGLYVVDNLSERILIEDVQYRGKWIHLILAEPIDSSAGYPNLLSVEE